MGGGWEAASLSRDGGRSKVPTHLPLTPRECGPLVPAGSPLVAMLSGRGGSASSLLYMAVIDTAGVDLITSGWW